MTQDLNEFEDALAGVVDGDEALRDRFADLLAESDEARDLLFDAERAAEEVGHAGAEFDPADDAALGERLAAGVLGAIDARGAAAPSPDASRASEASEASEARWSHDPAARFPAYESGQVPSPGAALTSADTIPERAENTRDSAAAAAPSRRRGGLFLVLGTGAALAAAAALGLAYVGASMMGGDPVADVRAPQGWSASLVTLTRASDDSQAAGLDIRLAGADTFSPVAAGSDIAAGATIRTDARTRAQIRLSDGTELTLNRDTEVTLETDGARALRLARGELLADVAHLDAGPNALLRTPHGFVEVLGTKFLLTTDEEHASVQVLRGEVRVQNGAGSGEVKAGQEGTLRPNGAPQVTPAMHLAAQVGWSELGPLADDDEVPVPGIGELRAHRPGEREEQERPLAIGEHKVDVRIVGNVARTTIEESFRNESGDVLEGVYRFPLPADARIASLQLLVEDEWEEGAIVGRDRAQAIWRGVIRNATPSARRQQRPQEEWIWVPGPWHDPALLEWQRGGRFELRIFPIPARGERRVRITYEQTISPATAGSRRYVYPLAHADADDDSTRVGHFEVDVRVAGDARAKARGYEMAEAAEDGAERLRFSADNFRPAGDLIIDYQLPGGEAELRYWTFQGEATVPPGDRSESRSSRRDSSRRDAEDSAVALQRELHEDTRPYVAFAPAARAAGVGRAAVAELRVRGGLQSEHGRRAMGTRRASPLAHRLGDGPARPLHRAGLRRRL